MKIGNEDFTLKKYVTMDDLKYNRYASLYSCYGRPSITKVRIDNYWRDLIYNNVDEVICYGVSGYNCNFFTLNGIVRIGDNKYYLYITKTRQEIHRIKED